MILWVKMFSDVSFFCLSNKQASIRPNILKLLNLCLSVLGGVEIGSQGDMFASQEVASQEVAQPRGNYVVLVDILGTLVSAQRDSMIIVK